MTNFKLKLNQFIKNNGRKIFIILIVWLVIVVVNYFLVNFKPDKTPITTYEPNKPIMDTMEKVPKNLQTPISEKIEEYMSYCNNKQYEDAWNMLSEDCREALYPSLEEFKRYIDKVFNQKKIYNIQNFSNEKDMYIYRIRILDDILSVGLKGSGKVQYYEEKIIIKNEDGNLKLSIAQYIRTDKLDKIYEDDYMKISITERNITYENEIYTIKITNRSEYTIVLADYSYEYEIALNLGGDTRSFKMEKLIPIILRPGETKEYKFQFAKYFDNGLESSSIILNTIRILKSYSGLEETRQSELDNAEKLYSLELPL